MTAILGKAHDRGEKNIPFHRIVYAGGRVWLGSKHKSRRLKLYKAEKIELDHRGFIKNFRDILYEFK